MSIEKFAKYLELSEWETEKYHEMEIRGNSTSSGLVWQ